MRQNRLAIAAITLLGAQLLHDVEVSFAGDRLKGESGAFGLLIGLVGLTATIVALVAALRRARSAPLLVGATGAAVAVGFVLYHGFPVDSAVTNSYWQRGNAVDWAVVLVCIAVGAWCALEARRLASPAVAAA